jgi:hypothetical protein
MDNFKNNRIIDIKDLVKFCRFYNGEENNPFEEQNRSMLWFYELSWCNDMLNDSKSLSIAIEEYVQIGLGSFEMRDGVPLSLKALLFNRYAKGCYSISDAVEPFKKFYKKYY